MNTTGNGNTAIGLFSLNSNTSGNNNTAIGLNSGCAITTGGCNTIIGIYSAVNRPTENCNIFISDGAGNLRLWVTGSNGTIHIPNSVSIDNQSPTAKLQVRGSGTTSATTAFLVQNSSSLNILSVLDNGTINLYGDTILNEELGFIYRTTQVSGSTVGAVTSSIWNLNFGSVSSSVYLTATVTGYDTGSRDTIAGDISATIRYRLDTATVIGTVDTFSNSDNGGVGFNVVAGGTSASLQVYGADSTTYQWGATVITQIL